MSSSIPGFFVYDRRLHNVDHVVTIGDYLCMTTGNYYVGWGGTRDTLLTRIAEAKQAQRTLTKLRAAVEQL